MKLLLRTLLCGVVMAANLMADGGTVIASGISNSFTITLLASPAPVHAGATDLSVLLETTASGNPVLNAEVTIRASQSKNEAITGKATHATATNKLLYAVTMNLPRPGRWTVQVECSTGNDRGFIDAQLEVSPEEPPLATHWPYLVVVPVGVLLFWLNQRLKANRTRLR